MRTVIAFLEHVGRDASLRHASREALLHAMHDEKIEATARAAMAHAQRPVLDDLAGARDIMYLKNTAIAPPKKKTPARKKSAKKAPRKKPAKKVPAKRKR